MIPPESPYIGWPGSPRLRVPQQLALGLFWLPNNALWTGLLLIVLPEKVLGIVGPGNATSVLSLTGILGTLVASVTLPLVGLLSDGWRSRLGRRRPLMIVGSIISFLFLLLLGYSSTLPLFIIGLVGVQLFNNVAQGAYQGLIPDLVAPEQRGEASGYMGLYNQIGVVVGGILGAFTSAIAFIWSSVVMLLCGLLITLGYVREPSSLHLAPQPLRRRLQEFSLRGPAYRDFWWVFATRFSVLVGLYVLQTYLLYYLRFVLGIRHAQLDVFLILIILSLTATGAALAGGYISDRYRRRRAIVAASGILQGVCALLFVFSHSLALVYLAAAIFGLGYGAYQSVDWALVVDTLPAGSAARDMGVWSISTTGSQLLAMVIGWLLAQLVIPALGNSLSYRLLFAVTFIFFLAGSVLVWKVRRVA